MTIIFIDCQISLAKSSNFRFLQQLIYFKQLSFLSLTKDKIQGVL